MILKLGVVTSCFISTISIFPFRAGLLDERIVFGLGVLRLGPGPLRRPHDHPGDGAGREIAGKISTLAMRALLYGIFYNFCTIYIISFVPAYVHSYNLKKMHSFPG